jgi:curli biogenesis system outer membrane secretion channel CsgG
MDKKAMMRILLSLLVLLTFSGCMESMVKPEAKTDTGAEMNLPPYSGPRARAAVADFEWKVDESSRTTKIGFGGQTMTISRSESSGYTTGLRDMLTTAMVQSKRFRVLERQNLDSLKSEMALTGSGYTDKTGVTKGAVKGADLLVMGAITGWEPGTSGGGGGLGGGGMLGQASALFGAVKGAYKQILDGHGYSHCRHPHLRGAGGHPCGGCCQGREYRGGAGRLRRQRRHGRRWADMQRRPWKKPSGPASTMRPSSLLRIHLRST